MKQSCCKCLLSPTGNAHHALQRICKAADLNKGTQIIDCISGHGPCLLPNVLALEICQACIQMRIHQLQQMVLDALLLFPW